MAITCTAVAHRDIQNVLQCTFNNFFKHPRCKMLMISKDDKNFYVTTTIFVSQSSLICPAFDPALF